MNFPATLPVIELILACRKGILIMNFNNQDKAFIITFSSASLLVLFFFFTTIDAFDSSQEEEFIDIPIVEEETLPEQEKIKDEKEAEIAKNEPISHQLKNNALQKEAERFFNQEDKIREAISSDQEEIQESKEEFQETDAAGVEAYKKKLEELQEEVKERKTAAEKAEKKPAKSEKAKPKKRTSISYILKQRNAIQIPNPVYTCDAGGKVVINIEVNRAGSVIKTTLNKAASSTTNGCLIDQALDYAARSIFDQGTDSRQLGSISFEFQK